MIPSILEPVESLQVERPDGSSKEYRKNWARLIQKIYQVGPLTCAKCGGEDEDFILHRRPGNN